jgi:hypothetical protein
MNIEALTTEELQKELKRREEAQDQQKDKQCLIIAIVAIAAGRPYTEFLKKIETAEDMPNLEFWKLRARMNGHRDYKMLHFKSDSYEELDKACEEDNEYFSDWLTSCDSIQSERL